MKNLIVFSLSTIFLLLWPCQPVSANVAEYFGSSFNTTGVGNQMNGDVTDPANNYYAPAMLAYAKKFSLNYSISNVSHDFKNIDGIVVKNLDNNSNAPIDEVGSANNEYDSFIYNNINIVLPLEKPLGTLAVSVFLPMGDVMQTNSGDPFLPEYVMYRARYRRVLSYINYAHALSDRFSFSVGAFLGFQVGADLNANASLNGTGYGSYANGKTKVGPSLSFIASAFYQLKNQQFYLTLHQEMKSNMEANSTGKTNNPPTLFDITVTSMLFYDPHIIRFGYARKMNAWQFLASLEYQIWDKYQTPVIRIRKNNGVLESSDDRERTTIDNIFVPKLGAKYQATAKSSISAGVSYRPTPLGGNFSGAGNSIDTDVTIYTLGYGYKFKAMKINYEAGIGYEFQKLKDVTVTKQAGLDSGAAGSRFGSPGYNIGGTTQMISLGLKLML